MVASSQTGLASADDEHVEDARPYAGARGASCRLSSSHPPRFASGSREQPLGGLAEQRAGRLPVDGVEAPLPSPLLAHQPRLLELPHVVGDLGLAHAEDPLELADADALVSLVGGHARV